MGSLDPTSIHSATHFLPTSMAPPSFLTSLLFPAQQRMASAILIFPTAARFPRYSIWIHFVGKDFFRCLQIIPSLATLRMHIRGWHHRLRLTLPRFVCFDTRMMFLREFLPSFLSLVHIQINSYVQHRNSSSPVRERRLRPSGPPCIRMHLRRFAASWADGQATCTRHPRCKFHVYA